jgi:hypothetical protein
MERSGQQAYLSSPARGSLTQISSKANDSSDQIEPNTAGATMHTVSLQRFPTVLNQ